MSRVRQAALYVGVVALAVVRFALTANDSPDTIAVPPGAAAREAPARQVGASCPLAGASLARCTGRLSIAELDRKI